MHADGIDIHVGRTLMHIKINNKGKRKKAQAAVKSPCLSLQRRQLCVTSTALNQKSQTAGYWERLLSIQEIIFYCPDYGSGYTDNT